MSSVTSHACDQGATNLQLLASKDQTLLVRGGCDMKTKSPSQQRVFPEVGVVNTFKSS